MDEVITVSEAERSEDRRAEAPGAQPHAAATSVRPPSPCSP
jgi:hypothetical protein